MGTVLVGIAEFKIVRAPDVLTTLGLGSCVGVTLYDPAGKLGGLLHVMLPEFGGGDQNRAKYADTGVEDLIGRMCAMGVRKEGLVAKIAGGAHMFMGTEGNRNFLKIGERNVSACVAALNRFGIQIRGNDTGGNYGRTIELDTDTGKLRVKTVGYGERYI